MNTATATARWTAAGALAAAIALLLFPVLRPWPDETVTSTALALSFSSGRWVAAHLCGIVGLGLLAPVFLGLRSLLRDSGTRTSGPSATPTIVTAIVSSGRIATAAAASAWAGAGLAALYFGAETFGIRTIAEAALRTGDLALLDEVTALREQPVALVLFGAGLLLIAAAGALVAVALWRARLGRRWAGIPLAVGLALFLPQFYGGPAVRVAHGVLVAAALLTLAAATLSLGGTGKLPAHRSAPPRARLSAPGTPAGRDV